MGPGLRREGQSRRSSTFAALANSAERVAMTARPTLRTLSADLAAGRKTSRALVEAALDRIADPAGEGKRAFVKVYDEAAPAAADAQDRLRAAGYVASRLAGIPIS